MYTLLELPATKSNGEDASSTASSDTTLTEDTVPDNDDDATPKLEKQESIASRRKWAQF